VYENEVPVATGAYYAFDTLSIENIGTLPAARGKGYAQIIVKKLLQEARKL
jgi:predicted GNAT family acetyltransferase